jgi:hypothetical protein
LIRLDKRCRSPGWNESLFALDARESIICQVFDDIHGARACLSCVHAHCVYGLGNTVEIWIWRITFRKMSICLIFLVCDEICP